MDDLDRMLAGALHDAADDAPSGAGLLGSVHERSRRHRRRRMVTVTAVSAVAAVVVAGIPVVTMLAARPESIAPPAASGPAVTGAPSGPAVSPRPSASSRPSGRASSAPASGHTSAAAGAVTLARGWTAPVFPYTLPATDGMSAPVGSMDDGELIGFFEATEDRHHADVTITVSDREPVFGAGASESPRQVRGHAGTLRTVDVEPAKQLTLYWKESAGRWIRLATDDTYTPDQVVALAESITAAAVAVPPPFDLDWSPGGLVTETVTASRMVFRSPDGGVVSTVLRKRRDLAGVNEKVNGYDAVLSRQSGQVTLSVDVADWDATLQITVSGGLTVSDTDLLRYAAGVRVLDRSDPE